ncbi:MAG: M14 family metallopeptidase [Anaerolineae bacterium]|nr:M14 family metallopeptidase [Anaerolineae bacterium]
MTETNYFPESYFNSRQRFRASLQSVGERWPLATLSNHMVQSDEDLTIDWIEAPAVSPDTLLLVTSGEHGVEAYAGCAVLQMIIEEFLPLLDSQRISLALVHTINPWGMAHHRRTNKGNVDINRNFVLDPMQLDPVFNPDYKRLNGLLNPRGKLRAYALQKKLFLPQALLTALATGTERLKRATLLGQYAFPQGIYYGGRSLQPETQVIMDLYRRWFGAHQKVVHIDLHTGYGPRYQMSIVNSAYEKAKSEELSLLFNYPLVVKSDPSEFYSISGDMIDYIYQMVPKTFPTCQFYSTTFEFGTLGDSLFNSLQSLRTMIHENQAKWFGAEDMAAVQADFDELYCPQEPQWREKVLADSRQALNGILSAWKVL